VVRHTGDRYQLIAGERRLRAAQEAGLKSVPVRVVDFNDQQAFEATLVENIQTRRFEPDRKALGFKEYLERFQINHEQLAQRLGLARSSITNLSTCWSYRMKYKTRSSQSNLRSAREAAQGIKEQGTPGALFKQIVAMGLSVKAAETLIREQKEGGHEDHPETNGANKRVSRR